MNMPRRGDEISIMPYGKGIVDKLLPNGRVLVTIDHVLKLPDGRLTNQVVVAQHPVWVPEATGVAGMSPTV